MAFLFGLLFGDFVKFGALESSAAAGLLSGEFANCSKFGALETAAGAAGLAPVAVEVTEADSADLFGKIVWCSAR